MSFFCNTTAMFSDRKLEQKTIALAGKTITKEQVNATAQITLTVQPGYSVSSSPLMLKISSDIKSLNTLNVNLSDVTTEFHETEPLPETVIVLGISALSPGCLITQEEKSPMPIEISKIDLLNLFIIYLTSR